ncbi:glycosyltransferase [Microbacterium sp. zg.Y1090]|uniref:glycosyltransferase family 2 protein n=1 Tax=Microbacterium wangruii TaxID=3049073 RepID=UPI00214CDF70|nr:MULTISPECIES: glycosyltransferase [unclassified Microbacterium]MCR2818054.1 glycosyltransferase [Microbacterium sp. zg.Y1090]WIM27788.1 glycosyltransferase [Microbacterium sp. zg-Y1090]
MPNMRSHAARAARRLLGARYDTVRARLVGAPLPPSPAREAAALQASGLFDADFYRRLRALPASTDPAKDYARYGSRQKLPFHPLIEPEYVGGDALVALSEGRVDDFLAALRRLPVDRWGPLLANWPVGQQLGADRNQLVVSMDGIAMSAEEAAERLIDFHAGLGHPTDEIGETDWQAALTAPRVEGRVSVIMLTYQDHAMTTAAVDAVLRTTENEDVEVVLVDNASRDAVGRVLVARYGSHPRVRYLRPAVNLNFGPGSNLGAIRSTGEYLMLLNNDTLPQKGWLAPLLARLTRPGVTAVQPLLLYPDGTVQTAGTVFAAPRSLAHHFLVGHPLADAVRHGGTGFRAITAGAMLIRASDFLSLRGFDPAYVNGQEDVDFCLRAARDIGGGFDVESSSRVIHFESKTPGRMARASANRQVLMHRWRAELTAADAQQYAEAGLELAHAQPDISGPFAIARPVAVRPRQERKPRWSIATDIPAAEIILGDGPSPHWSLVRELVASIEDLGHEVTVDAAEVRLRATAYLDDIRLVFGARSDASPWLGRFNVLLSNGDTTAGHDDGFDARLTIPSLANPAEAAARLRDISASAGFPVADV